MAGGPDDRKQLAEQWRVLGEKLRERSPAAFTKLVAMLAASATNEGDDDAKNIDGVYPFH